MEKTNDARFRNGYENRARLADILTDDLIENIENGRFPEKVFEVLKYLWEYELREKMLAAGLDECPVFREGMLADGEEGEPDDGEPKDGAIAPEAKNKVLLGLKTALHALGDAAAELETALDGKK